MGGMFFKPVDHELVTFLFGHAAKY
jgi:hypothetical protein